MPESDASVSSVAVWERLVRFQRLALAAMDEHLRVATGHSLDDYDVLHHVSTNDGRITMGELADRLLVANSSCHRIVGRLVDAGHLLRRRGEVDRREVWVELTPAGRRLHRRMAVVHTRDIKGFLGPLTDDELHTVEVAIGRAMARPDLVPD